jgi:hypothetical protein
MKLLIGHLRIKILRLYLTNVHTLSFADLTYFRASATLLLVVSRTINLFFEKIIKFDCA